MTLLVGKHTRAIVQGITGNQGAFHTRLMLDYGTQIVGGVTPGKGATVSQGVPVFDTVASALEKIDANASIIFVPAPFAKEDRKSTRLNSSHRCTSYAVFCLKK